MGFPNHTPENVIRNINGKEFIGVFMLWEKDDSEKLTIVKNKLKQHFGKVRTVKVADVDSMNHCIENRVFLLIESDRNTHEDCKFLEDIETEFNMKTH